MDERKAMGADKVVGAGRAMQEPPNHSQAYWRWEGRAASLIQEEMRRRGIRYKELARMLEALGIEESATQINRKINRQRFSAAFLLACLHVLGVENIARK